MSAGIFQPPEKGTPAYTTWLDGPRPEAGNGRGQWLRARQLRDKAAKAAEAAAAEAAAGADAGGAEAQTRMAASLGQPATPVPTGDAATRAVLIGIRDDASAHDSDRIRAAQALIAMERSEVQDAAPSPLVALRAVLDTLAPHERLVWLQGERLGGYAAEGEETRVGAHGEEA